MLLRFRAETREGEADGGSLALDLATRCALARLSEIDDIHLASMTTPGAIVIPGALTLAAATPEAKADDVIAAILAGYEAMTRLGRAIDGPTALYRGIWPTYFAAPFGIAAVAARLLGLDAQAAANALALALTLAAPGVGHHNAQTTARWLAVGNAARNGLAAALAAKAGFTSDLKLIEGNFLSGVYGVTPDGAALTSGLGEQPRAGAGVVQAVVRGAPDHGGDAGAQGDHRERRRARDHDRDQGGGAAAAPQDDRPRRRGRRPRLASHQPAILHGGGGGGAGPGVRRRRSHPRACRRRCAPSWTRSRSRPTSGCSPTIRAPGRRG